jgi:hypothetical protein
MFNEGSQNFEQAPVANEPEALGNLQVAQPAEAAPSIAPTPEQAPNELQNAEQELLAAQQQIQDLTQGTEAAAKAIGSEQELVSTKENPDEPQSLIVDSTADVQDLVASAQADFQQAAAEAEQQAAVEAEQVATETAEPATEQISEPETFTVEAAPTIEDIPMAEPAIEDAPAVAETPEVPVVEETPMPDYVPMDTEPQAETEPATAGVIDQDINSIQDDAPIEAAPMSPLQALGASPNIQTSMDPLAQEGGAPEDTQDQTEAQPEEEEPEGPLMSIFG